MSLVPLLPFLLAVLIIIFVVFLNVLDDKVYVLMLILSLLNALGFLAYIPFYNEYIKVNWFTYLFLSHISVNVLMLVVSLLVYFKKVLFFKYHYKIFLRSIKATKWNAYYVVDHKGKIKEMSDSVLEELGFNFSEVKGKNLFDIFNKSIRVTNFDEVETNNRSLEVYYQEYPDTVSKDQLNTHALIFQNHQGRSVLLRTVEQPIFIMGKYKGRINIGEKRSDFDLVGIEGKLREKEKELDSLRQKYIATLELANDAFYYIDIDQKYIWGGKKFLDLIGFKDNTINYKDFQSGIYPDDLNSYLGTLSSLTVRKQEFKTSYRFLINGQYVWLKDKGKRIFDGESSNIILGALSQAGTSSYSSTGFEIIDSLKTESEIQSYLKVQFANKRRFQLALFELKNIPEINKEYGRSVGNMVMAEYVKKLKTAFVSGESEIFRMSGLVFAVTIFDSQKMGILKNGILSNPKFLNLEVSYGVVSTELEILMGITSSYENVKSSEELLKQAEQALALTRHQNYQANVCYYNDINE